MHSPRKAIASALAVTVLSALAVALSTTANAAGCSAFAYEPNKNGETAQGTAGRSGCPSNRFVKITTRLYHYQPYWADEVKAETVGQAVANVRFTNRWTRPNTGVANGWDWYSYAVTNSGQVSQSTLVRLW